MKISAAIILLFCCCHAMAQDSLNNFNLRQYKITTTGMKTLGGWGAANIIAGGTGWAITGNSTKYFYQMNAFWGAANLGIAILGNTGAQKNKDKNLTATETLKEQHKIESIFLINGGLDVAYIATGIFLNHRGNIKNNEQLKGYGPAVIMQGAFLLVFDSIMYSSHRKNGNRLIRFLAKNPVIFDGTKVGILIKL